MSARDGMMLIITRNVNRVGEKKMNQTSALLLQPPPTPQVALALLISRNQRKRFWV